MSLDALVLAGGLGTRLAPTIGSLPKGLAPIRGRPFLDILLEYLMHEGVRRVVLGIGHGRDAIKERYARFPGLRIAFSEEMEPLGTGGAILNARGVIASDPFLVLNGDSLCRVDLNTLLRFHVEKHAKATLTLSPASERADVGRVVVDAKQRVQRFDEKGSAPADRAWTNAGVYVLAKGLFANMKPEACSLERDLIPTWVAENKCFGFLTEEPVIDIGTPERYGKAQGGIL